MIVGTDSQATQPGQLSFSQHLKRDRRPGDALVLLGIPVVLGLVFLLPESTRYGMAFDVGDPSVVDAYTAHFVHGSDWHLAGNLAVFLVVAPVTYLLCLLGGWRRLFWYATVTFLTAFPFALSAMQLSFLTERTTLGFSGINAAFVGLLCFVVVSYAGRVLSPGITDHHAPALLFVVLGLVALVSLPERAWRLELALLSFGLSGVYIVSAIRELGFPTLTSVREAVKPGYVELAGGGLGLVLVYPFVGFQGRVLLDGSVVDVYIHLLGFALAFLLVYVFVVVTKDERGR